MDIVFLVVWERMGKITIHPKSWKLMDLTSVFLLPCFLVIRVGGCLVLRGLYCFWAFRTIWPKSLAFYNRVECDQYTVYLILINII